VTRVNRA